MPLPTSAGAQTKPGGKRGNGAIVPSTHFALASPAPAWGVRGAGGSYASGGGAPRPPMSGGAPQYGNPAPAAPMASPKPGGGGGGGNNNGGGGGNGGGKGGKNNGVPGIGKYLKSDEQYQQDRAALIKNFRNLAASSAENRGNVNTDFGLTRSRLRREQQDALQAMRDDFAARGLYGGAEYLGAEQEFNQGYMDQFADAESSRDRNIAQLLRELANARTLRDENLSQARLEAIRRRAAEYGIR